MADNPEFEDEELKRLKGQLQLAALRKEHDLVHGRNGFLSSYHEWHAATAGAGLITLGFLFSGAFVYIYFLVMLKVLVDQVTPWTQTSGLVKEIGKELQYYIGAGAIAALLFTGAGHAPPQVPYSLAEIAMTALLG